MAVPSRAVALAIISLFLLAACGVSAVDDEAQRSPFVERFGIPRNSSEALAFATTVHDEAQDGVVECMAAAGFQYRSTPYGDFSMISSSSSLSLYESLSNRERFGFGITTDVAAPVLPDDPNVDLYFSLSVDEQNAWNAELYGEGFDSLVQEPDGQIAQGCLAQAETDVLERTGRYVSTEVRSEFTEMEERVAADPSVVAATTAWSECATQADFPLASPKDARADLLGRIGEPGLDPECEIDLAVGIYECDQEFLDAESAARSREDQRVLDLFDE
ncbi:hypothetical protein JYT35_00535 [Acidimicrobium ferrooxidans]|uniref:Uncharacterized protein n=1 Tax=Acidimicrobium ferrooxidans TaxID=53635 RepID=A0ABS3AQL0_9ACTN|nr:hypothetical protein [Acidimicrobium ferrooxidans]